ncbi:hypothetical protein, partial [Streptomyces sp. NPDC059008]
ERVVRRVFLDQGTLPEPLPQQERTVAPSPRAAAAAAGLVKLPSPRAAADDEVTTPGDPDVEMAG